MRSVARVLLALLLTIALLGVGTANVAGDPGAVDAGSARWPTPGDRTLVVPRDRPTALIDEALSAAADGAPRFTPPADPVAVGAGWQSLCPTPLLTSGITTGAQSLDRARIGFGRGSACSPYGWCVSRIAFAPPFLSLMARTGLCSHHTTAPPPFSTA